MDQNSVLQIVGAITLGFAPGVFWLWYIVRKDRLEPEPAKYVVGMYFWGMLSTIPAILVEWPFAQYFSEFVVVGVVAPVVEELLKFGALLLALKLFSGLNREFDEPMDGIVYAGAVALGFASLENAGYILRSMAEGTLTSTFIARAVLSVPGHVLFSSMWGYALGMSRFVDATTPGWRPKPISGALFGILFHMIFNLSVLLSASLTFLLTIVAIVVFWKVLYLNIAKALAASPHLGQKVDSTSETDVSGE